MILDVIVEKKRLEVEERRRRRPFASVRRAAEERPGPRPFGAALQAGDPVALIAEIKRASPTAGVIREACDVAPIGAMYERAGAAAISVLTDAPFFGGNLADLDAVRCAVSLPLLRKDFVIDPYQVAEAGAAGADALLLIAAILPGGALADLLACAAALHLEALVEVHDGRELDRALAAGAPIVGVNNRNLRTFAVDLGLSRDLVRAIPPGVVRVSESGITSAEEVRALGAAGFDAVLVGEALMRAPSPEEAARRLLGEEG